MQTFLPFPSFAASAEVLDYRRLGKQRVETWQILRALAGETRGWVSHPASKMWRGHETALVEYGVKICEEWIQRGYKDTMLDRFVQMRTGETVAMPAWFGDPEFHRSHQSNLVRKNPEYYEPLFPDVPPDLEYIWPVE
jgi:hypothetical protein